VNIMRPAARSAARRNFVIVCFTTVVSSGCPAVASERLF